MDFFWSHVSLFQQANQILFPVHFETEKAQLIYLCLAKAVDEREIHVWLIRRGPTGIHPQLSDKAANMQERLRSHYCFALIRLVSNDHSIMEFIDELSIVVSRALLNCQFTLEDSLAVRVGNTTRCRHCRLPRRSNTSNPQNYRYNKLGACCSLYLRLHPFFLGVDWTRVSRHISKTSGISLQTSQWFS